MLQAVTWVALALSVASFAAFVVFGLLMLRKAQAPETPHVAAPAALDDVARLIEAVGKLVEGLSKLTDSLARAGPAIAALVASMVFLFAALVSAR